jgi:DNA-binding HxlR family transcriptional regulator
MVRVNEEDILKPECAAPSVLNLIASKWTVMVMHVLRDDVKRYSELTSAMPGITQKVLTATLRKLERNGIVERTVYPVVPPKVDYKLTKLGYELLHATEGMAEWAESYSKEVTKAQLEYDNRNSL